MLLVEITINGTVHYISNDWHDLPDHFYNAYIASLGQLRIGTRKEYGGFSEPTYGALELVPKTFETAGDWPPPVSCAVKIQIATQSVGAYVITPWAEELTDEGGIIYIDGSGASYGESGVDSVWQDGAVTAEALFEGTAHLNPLARDGVTYDLYGPSITTEVTDAVYSGTLTSIFSTACTTLGLTLNSTYARASSPAVVYTASGVKKLVDNLSEMAEFFTHRFYIEAGTLYLIDCLLDNSTLAYTEFDIFPSGYVGAPPLKELTSVYGTDLTARVAGTHPYGASEQISPCCHNVLANVEAALTNIKTVLERKRIQLTKPLSGVPKVGTKISLIDESLYRSTTVWARVSAVVWDFDNEQCVIEGEGALTLTA